MDKNLLTEEKHIIGSDFLPSFLEEVDTAIYSRFLKPTKEKALFILMMDVSGSMGIWEKYMIRSVYFWTRKVLERKYESVDVLFISHHTEANISTFADMFSKGESGGTIASCALRLVLQYLSENDFSHHDIYLMHGTDGDNLTSDNKRYITLFEEISLICRRASVINVNQYERHNTLASAFKGKPYQERDFFIMKERSHVYDALVHYFYPLSSEITNIGHVRFLDKEF